MKIAYLAAILSVTLVAFEVSAEPPDGRNGDKGKNASGQRDNGNRGVGRRAERGKGGRGQADGAQREPAQLAATMMKQFDKDGDKKLSTSELTALLTSLRDRRGGKQGGTDGARRSRGQDGQGKAKGKGKSRDGGKANPAGGQKPKRPSSDG